MGKNRFFSSIVLNFFLCCFSGCVLVREKKFDFDNDGFVDQTIAYNSSQVLSESIDTNQDGVIDVIYYYDRNKTIYMKEYDTDADQKIDLREEFFPNRTIKKSKDIDKDGNMDCCTIIHFDQEYQPIFSEIDWNMDGQIDSKFDFLEQVRLDKIHKSWYQSILMGKKRFAYIAKKFFPIIFSNGEWIIKNK